MRIQDNALQLRLQTESNVNLNLSLGYSYSGDYGQINCDESGVDQKDLWYTALNHKFGRNTSIQNMVLNSSGNLGIGTSLPDCKVHVEAADGVAGGAIRYTATGVASVYMSADPNGLCLATDTAGITFRTGVSGNDPTDTGSEKVRISSAGGFSVGTTADPGAGAITATGNITGGNLTTAGTMTAGTVTETSSIALKENFRPIENPLEKVLQLLGQIYDRKDGSSKDEAGLVAEDVYKIIPNLVKTDSNGNPESVFYSRLSVYLLESIKVLNDEIAILKGTTKNIKK
jgi:hypothetical protein